MKKVHIYKDPMSTTKLIFFSKNSSFSHLSRIHGVAGQFFGQGLPHLEWMNSDEIEDLLTSKLFRFRDTQQNVARALKLGW